MAGRPVILSSVGGINLLRTKGGAKPENLRDLLNGYVDQDGIATSRPGSLGAAITPTTIARGLTAYKGALYAFAHEPVTWDSSGGDAPAVSTLVLVNRRDPFSPIRKVWFVGEYMGLLYVAVEYDNGDVVHFWLEQVAEWAPDTVYTLGQLVRPSGDGSGYVFRAGRSGAGYPPWAPDVARTVGDRVEPTTPTGWYYEVTATSGDAPRSGKVEPIWPQVDGAVVYEDVDGVSTVPGTDSGSPPDTSLPGSIGDRYDNPNTRGNDTRAIQ